MIRTSVCLCMFMFEGGRDRKVCVSSCACVCVCVRGCAHTGLSKYLKVFSCRRENVYWNDYRLINDPV